ncbi:hypothetical protein M407DRAFT_33447 [Tulasnella calospora MUT 4182]|uniref:DUF6532 domain-containing protein n=1 Tax=Tulasnella calospora MUT 4182 TaxID=1051891 RepID=A0A0C3PQP6_9AGAM|nr:hypothetical protein M407DRAFT_33447 [Tulasnella calospora MUT 4182]
MPSRIANSKGHAPSPSNGHTTHKNSSGQNPNKSSLRPQPHHSTAAATRARRNLTKNSDPSDDFDLGEFSADNAVPTTLKSAKAKGSAKTTTAKDRRRATLAAAEANAARLKTTHVEWGESDADEPGTGSTVRTASASAVTTADENDDNDAPETSRRPKLSTSRSQDTDIDEDDDGDDDGMEYGGSGLENDDLDEDDPANSPIRDRQRKTTGAMFTEPTTTRITSKLPAKRTLATKNPSKDSRDTPATSSSPLGSRSSAVASPRTPRKARGGRPRLGDQTPTTAGIIKAAASDTRQALILEDAFPDRPTFVEQCKAIFMATCADFQATIPQCRFQKSETYRGLVLALLKQKLPQVRQEVRIAALSKTALHYGINSSSPAAEIIAMVNRLKHKMTYVFSNTLERKGPYGNPMIQILINSLFFEGKRKSDAIANPIPWNPMPLPVIALVATAVESVLDDWSTGRNEAAKNKFSRDNYESVYRTHLANLAKFQQKAPKALALLRTSLWENAWSSTNTAFPEEISAPIEDDVFEAAEAEALDALA